MAGAVIEHRRDGGGRLGSVALGGNVVAAFDYFDDGSPKRITYATGAVAEHQYDSRGRLAGLSLKQAGGDVLAMSWAHGLDGAPRARSLQIGKTARSDYFQVDPAVGYWLRASAVRGPSARCRPWWPIRT